SIDEAAETLQIIERADKHGTLWRESSFEVRPFGGDERLTAVRQNEHELQARGHAGLSQDLQRLSVEWMMRARDGHAFGKLLMVGSVWWFPSIESITTN